MQQSKIKLHGFPALLSLTMMLSPELDCMDSAGSFVGLEKLHTLYCTQRMRVYAQEATAEAGFAEPRDTGRRCAHNTSGGRQTGSREGNGWSRDVSADGLQVAEDAVVEDVDRQRKCNVSMWHMSLRGLLDRLVYDEEDWFGARCGSHCGDVEFFRVLLVHDSRCV